MRWNNRYFLMRHGESEANIIDLIVSDPELGSLKYGLTERGREQARHSAEQSGLGSETRIVASDFLRTRQTAEIARETLGSLQVSVEPMLRERNFGELDGEKGERYKEVWQLDSSDPENGIFGVESPNHLADRLRWMMRRLEALYAGETLLLVSHGDTLRFLQLVAADLPLTEHMRVRHFGPAEIRALEDLPNATD